MNKYISFTSVLQDKFPKQDIRHNRQKSLAMLMEEFAIFPQRDFNLYYNQRQRKVPINHNHRPSQPLNLHNYIQQIPSQQPEIPKKIPPELIKYAYATKKRSLSTNNLNLPKAKEGGIKKLCEIYNEDQSNDSQFTWKCPQNINKKENQKPTSSRLKEQNIKMQSQQQLFENNYLQRRNLKKNTQPKIDQNLTKDPLWIDKLKGKLSLEVQQLANLLISEKKKQQKQQMLIGSENQDNIVQQVKNQINQYLKLKKQSKKSLSKRQQQDSSLRIDAYSFSSDFRANRLNAPEIVERIQQEKAPDSNYSSKDQLKSSTKEKQNLSLKNSLNKSNEQSDKEIESQKINHKTTYLLKKEALAIKKVKEQKNRINEPINVQIIESTMVQEKNQQKKQLQNPNKGQQIKQLPFLPIPKNQNRNEQKHINLKPIVIKYEPNTRIIYDGMQQYKKYRQNQIKNMNKENNNINEVHNVTLPKLSESIKHRELNKQKQIEPNKIIKNTNMISSLAVKNLQQEKIHGSNREQEIGHDQNQNLEILIDQKLSRG